MTLRTSGSQESSVTDLTLDMCTPRLLQNRRKLVWHKNYREVRSNTIKMYTKWCMQGGGVDIYITVTIEILDNSSIQSRLYHTVVYVKNHCIQFVQNVTRIDAQGPRCSWMHFFGSLFHFLFLLTHTEQGVVNSLHRHTSRIKNVYKHWKITMIILNNKGELNSNSYRKVTIINTHIPMNTRAFYT